MGSHAHSHDHDHGHAHDVCAKAEAKPTGECGHGHAASSDEKARRAAVIRKLKTACVLCLAFFIVEVIGGILAGSLAVLSDAAHLAADMSAFAVAIAGSHIASLPASDSHTFGLKRTESLAALFSMVSLAILSVGLAVEAIHRLWIIVYMPEDAVEVDGKLMSGIAFIGVLVNVALAFVLGEDHVHMPGADHGCSHAHGSDDDHSGHDHGHNHGAEASSLLSTKKESKEDDDHSGHDHGHNHGEEASSLLSTKKEDTYSSCHDVEIQHVDEILPEHEQSSSKPRTPQRNVNLHAAYLHVLADLTQSAVVFIAGLIIWAHPTWQIVDPVCTLIFSILVCFSTVGVIRSSLSVLLEEVPQGVNWEEVHTAISAVEGVSGVHDLHIWSISHDNYILSVHANAVDVERALGDIKKVCNERHIDHLTVQLQPDTVEDCVTCSEDLTHSCR